RHRSAVFRPSSRESCLHSSAALLDFHRQFYELPRLRSYRWLIQGMISFNALQGAMAMASCLLDDTSDPQSRDYETMLVAAVVRIENLQVSSPVCARAYPILRQLQKHVSECLNHGTGTGTVGNQTMGTWFDTDWLNSETFDWMTWDTILPNPTG
ncbi:hypothetical protein F5X68DRAFT_239907, partial [Plectosphaerella plurivora]